MRYTTRPFGEVVKCLGRFTSGRLATEVQLVLINLETNAVQPITTPNCTEVTGSAFGSRSAYFWPTSNITTQPSVKTEFLYIMTDTVTGQVQEGKIVLGGYPDQVAISRFEGAVHIDTISGGVPLTTPGVFEFPIGTPTTPVNNITDARTIADFLNVRQYHINGSVTLAVNHDNWTFEGEEPRQDIVVVNPGISVADSSFERIGIRGTLSGAISASECLIGPTGGGTLNVDGVFTDCGFAGTIRVASGGVFRGLRINFLDLGGTILDFNNPGAVTQFLAITSGNFNVRNANVNTLMGVVMNGGQLVHEVSIVNATSFLYGTGERSDAATSWLVDNDFLIRGSRVDVEISSRPDPATVADVVWDEIRSGHVTPGTFGEMARFLHATAAGRVRLNTSNSSQWTIELFDPDETTIIRTLNLKDQLGAAITSTNNPLTLPGTVLFADRDPV